MGYTNTMRETCQTAIRLAAERRFGAASRQMAKALEQTVRYIRADAATRLR